MIDIATWKKGWALLDKRERRNAWIVLGIIILAALSAAVMVGSIMPFLSVLSEPERIRSEPLLTWAYKAGGFSSDYSFLVALGLASMLVIILASILQILRTWAVARFALMRAHTISYRLLASYLKQPYEYFLDHHSGATSTQILAEAQEVVQQFFRPAAELISSSLTVVSIVALLFWVNPIVALAALAVMGGFYGGAYAISRRIVARLGRIRLSANQARYRIATEALGGVKDIKLLGRESSYLARYQAPSHRMARTLIGVNVIGEIPRYVMQAVAFGGIILLCVLLLDPEGLASGAALGGILPLLGVFALAGQRMMPELSKFYRGLTQLNYGSAAVHAVHADLMQTASAAGLPRTPPAPLGLRQQLQLQRISYRYPQADRASLSDVTLTIRVGEKIGVVGSTGAGKTTLADIILGLLRPSEGNLVADGEPITDDRIRAWQQSVGYVPQDIFLTDASVAENIALGVPCAEINQQRVEEAARIAQLDRFIRENLPQGYATAIGERGVRLSGGQRQRIGIARALYHDADLIVFDEATSGLDNLTEREVMTAIQKLPGDKSVLVIAHRLSTVEPCDRIVVLEQGRLAGCDSWEKLILENEVFRRIALVA